jgi:transglutaminase superfamily protein
VKFLRPIPRSVSRPLSLLIVLAWVLQMGSLLHRSYLQASSVSLAGDLSRYGSAAQWKGVYYRGEKIGYAVTQTVPAGDGYELQEDGQIQMMLLGASTAARIRTLARVDKAFALQSFSFSLDPGSGAVEVSGTLGDGGRRLDLTTRTKAGTRTETRALDEPPALSLNLSRRLAAAGLATGQHLTVPVFDPATMRNSPMTVDVEAREVVRAAGKPVPAFRVRMEFAGITSTSWVTDVGEVVREESGMGLIVVKETRDRALALAVPGDLQKDMLEAAAVAPSGPGKIDDPKLVDVLRLRVEGLPPDGADRQGAGQTFTGDLIEIRDQTAASAEAADPDAARHLGPEPFVESDAPEVLAEAKKAVAEVTGPRAQAERLVRYVNALIEKKPTVSLPSALEVLRTRVGDCNEHTVLYVAMARALGIPSRIAVGLVYLHGAFYYHAWPEVYLEGPPGRGLWLPVDPTLNEFPADATHVRLARGGLDRQAAILPLIGRIRLSIVEAQARPGATPVLLGRAARDTRPIELAFPRREGGGPTCWSRPAR